jgi:hypothetical protein
MAGPLVVEVEVEVEEAAAAAVLLLLQGLEQVLPWTPTRIGSVSGRPRH